MAELGKSFEGATTIEHAILSTYDIVTPVAEMPDGQNFLTYVSFEDTDGSVISEFQTHPAEVIESYNAINHVGLSDMSPEGMDNYMISTVQAALQALPYEVAVGAILRGRNEVIVPDPESPEREGWEMPENGMDIREIVQIQSGNVSADEAHEILIRGDLPELLADALNNAGLDVDANEISRLHEHAKIARDLPGNAHELKTMLEDPAQVVKHGIPADQVKTAMDALSGEAPPPMPGNDPALEVTLPEQ